MSSTIPKPVQVAPNMTVCVKIPAIRNSRYDVPGTEIALPNTYANKSTNMIGDKVVNTSRSGTRLILIKFRLAMVKPSSSAICTVISDPPVQPGARSV